MNGLGDLVIEARALTKRYGDSIVAVDGLDLGVRRGEVYSFLGPKARQDHHAADDPRPRATHFGGGARALRRAR